MSPPPSTPTPRRFLLAKRGAATQRSQTPTPRFYSTPRFGSTSVPRPTQKDIEDVEDVVEESSVEDEDEEDGVEGEDGQGGMRHLPVNDSIEVESDPGTDADSGVSSNEQASDFGGANNRAFSGSPELSERSSPLQARATKRRRVTISPEPGSTPSHQHTSGPYAPASGGFPDAITPTGHAAPTTKRHLDDPRALPQPTFRAAPRFKPAELDAVAADGILAVFSPQRRGAKYVAGGLAAGLQGWLSAVKGWEGVDNNNNGDDDGGSSSRSRVSATRLRVDEVRPGRRMYLVEGRVDAGHGPVPRRFVLAGEGKLTGLGRRADVAAGSVVIVGQPFWDTEIDGVTWTVACDWSVS